MNVIDREVIRSCFFELSDAKLAIIERAIWEGDCDKLWELAPCRCCCGEHTFECCPARLWYACRGQGSMTRAEEQSWVEHYVRFHGMTREEFYAA